MASKEYHNALEMLNKKDKYNYIRAFEMLNGKEKEYVIKAMNGKEGKYDKPKYKLIFVEKIGDSFKYEGKKYKLHPTYNNLMFSADGDVWVVSEPKKRMERIMKCLRENRKFLWTAIEENVFRI